MPILTLQPNAADGLDTNIRSNNPTFNFGININWFIGRSGAGAIERGLLKFSGLSVLLPNYVINSALLTLENRGELSATAFRIYAHRSLVEWFEGNSNGAAPPAGDHASTYNLRDAFAAAPLTWAGGAGGAAGSDYATTATDSVLVSGIAPFTLTVTADVAAWVAGSAPNHGWWLLGDETVNSTRKQPANSDNANAALRPLLVVDYAIPGLLPKIMQYGQYSGGTL